MKLSTLLQYVPHVELITRMDPDTIEVNRVVELHDDTLDEDVLRWTAQPKGFIGINGVLITPEAKAGMPGATVVCSDPKESIIAAINAFYPYGPPDARVHIAEPGWQCHPSTIIGGNGFGFHKGQRFPHIGGVRIGARVEVGSNTCIDRGAIGDTVIGDDVKIDNLVHIAHNVRIGRGTQVIAGAVIGGSAVIGENCFIGINASIKNKVRIGNNVTIGMGAVVIRDVPDGATVVGNPARILTPTP